jgi:hypothetical protein
LVARDFMAAWEAADSTVELAAFMAASTSMVGAGGFHGGGFHAGRLAMGGSRGGAGHGGVANLHDGFGFGARDGGHWAYGWYNGRYGWWRGDGLGWTYYPYPYDADYGDYSLPAAAPYWYCSDPPGYYPYLTQCNTAWQTAPGS